MWKYLAAWFPMLLLAIINGALREMLYKESLGAPDYTLFRASGDVLGHLVNEFKVMVPAQEVLEAEEQLKSLDLLPP